MRLTAPSRRTACVVTAAAALLLPATQAAQADPGDPIPSRQDVANAQAAVGAKRQDVAAIQAELSRSSAEADAAGAKAEMAAERYNEAQWKLGLAKQAQTSTARKAAAAQQKVVDQRDDMARMVTRSFRSTPELDRVTAIVTADGPETLMDRYGAVHGATVSMDHAYDQFVQVRTAAQTAKARAAKARKAAERMASRARSAAAAAASADAVAEAENARIAATQTRLLGELARAQGVSLQVARARQRGLEARAAAAAAAAAKAKAEQQSHQTPPPSPSSPTPSPGPSPTKPPTPSQPTPTPTPTKPPSSGGSGGSGSTPAPSGGAAAAIAFAKQQLGEPYKWGAAGPNSWDCSGLTMMAWRAGGKSLPHYSAGQYSVVTHITRSQLQPGDLVFWGGSPGSIHHVALYIGNGQILHAPRTGRPVAINDIDYWIPPNYFGRP